MMPSSVQQLSLQEDTTEGKSFIFQVFSTLVNRNRNERIFSNSVVGFVLHSSKIFFYTIKKNKTDSYEASLIRLHHEETLHKTFQMDGKIAIKMLH